MILHCGDGYIMKPIYIGKFIYLFLCIVLLSACEAPYMQQKDVEQPTMGQSVVFGHADVVVDGKIQEWGYGWTGVKSCCLLILPPESTKAITYKLDEDGIFYWSLNPGEYQILGFRFQKGTESRIGRVGATFTVPENTEAVYIGDVTIEMKGRRSRAVVKDNSSAMRATYKSKFSDQPGQVTTSLLQLPDRIGTYDRIISECSDHWVVDCSEDYKGVTPLSPKVVTKQFSQTESLMPRFSWKPAGSSGVSYDLIVYEAATYSYVGTDDGIMLGRMVVYEENIQTPNYQLKTPLKKKTKYFWSVRLRDEEEEWVSRWSTYSHFGFYVFYMTSGYGQWFAFSTP